MPMATPHAEATARMLSAPKPLVAAIPYAASRTCSLLMTGRFPMAVSFWCRAAGAAPCDWPYRRYHGEDSMNRHMPLANAGLAS